ncbi:MAG: hypothetical protein ACK52M_06690, partial [bacterium]
RISGDCIALTASWLSGLTIDAGDWLGKHRRRDGAGRGEHGDNDRKQSRARSRHGRRNGSDHNASWD